MRCASPLPRLLMLLVRQLIRLLASAGLLNLEPLGRLWLFVTQPARTGRGMAQQRAGAARARCRRDGLFVDGVKVPIGPGGAMALWRDGDRVRQVTPASLARIMQARTAPLEVLVVPYGASVQPGWFDQLPPALAVWRGRVDAAASAARSRRRVRQIAFWDDRNLLSCVNFIRDHPDPAVPEQRLLAAAALAAAEARQVAFVRRRASLEALVRAGERSSMVAQDLSLVRLLQRGTADHPLTPSGDRRVLRRRAIRLLNRSEAAAARLESVPALDRSGAALAVASRIAAVDAQRAAEAALALTAAAAATQIVYVASTPQAGLWAYRALATLSVFARANARTIERSDKDVPARAQVRQQRWERDHELLSRSAPDAMLADAATHAVSSAASLPGTPVQRAASVAPAAVQHLADSALVAASATYQLAQGRHLRSLLVNLAGSAAMVSLHAQAAQLVSAAHGDLSAAGVELASAAALGVSAAALGRSRSPGSQLAREAKQVRRTFARSRQRSAERDALALLWDATAPGLPSHGASSLPAAVRMGPLAKVVQR